MNSDFTTWKHPWKNDLKAMSDMLESNSADMPHISSINFAAPNLPIAEQIRHMVSALQKTAPCPHCYEGLVLRREYLLSKEAEAKDNAEELSSESIDESKEER